MDTTEEKKFRFTLTALVMEQEGYDRLREKHGFTAKENTRFYIEKEIEGTWDDVVSYGRTLQGIVGVDSLTMSIGAGPDDKMEPVGPDMGAK